MDSRFPKPVWETLVPQTHVKLAKQNNDQYVIRNSQVTYMFRNITGRMILGNVPVYKLQSWILVVILPLTSCV